MVQIKEGFMHFRDGAERPNPKEDLMELALEDGAGNPVDLVLRVTARERRKDRYLLWGGVDDDEEGHLMQVIIHHGRLRPTDGVRISSNNTYQP